MDTFQDHNQFFNAEIKQSKQEIRVTVNNIAVSIPVNPTI